MGRDVDAAVLVDRVVVEPVLEAQEKLVEDAPGFSRKLLEAMANRIRELDKKLVC